MAFLLVADLVESVRLMRQDETAAVERWVGVVRHAERQLMPREARLYSLGDGLLFVLDEVEQALSLARALHVSVEALSAGLSAEEAFWLRVAVVQGELPAQPEGWPGLMGLTLQRGQYLAAQAAPGLTLLDEPVHAALEQSQRGGWQRVGWLPPAQDGEDLAWSLPAPPAPQRPALPQDDIRPAVAVVLMALPLTYPADWAGALVDDLARAMARCPLWRICASSSSRSLPAGVLGPAQTGLALGVTHLVELDLVASPPGLTLRLRHAASAQLIHEEGSRLPADLSQNDRIALGFARRALERLAGVERSFETEPALVHLEAYALLLNAQAQMHRCQFAAMQRSTEMLAHLAHRHPRAGEVAAWQALRQVFELFSTRLGESDPRGAAQRSVERALAVDGGHPLAQIALAHFHMRLSLDFGAAQAALEQAITVNPNEPLAWLFRASLHLIDDQPIAAAQAVDLALQLAPQDPARYFFDNFAAAAFTEAGQHARALRHARRALLLNPAHLPSLAQLIVTEVGAGEMDAARAHAAQYLQQRPQAQVQRLLEPYEGRGRGYVQRQVDAYLLAGFPP